MGSSYGRVVVAAGMLMTCVSMGAMFSLAVFLEPIGAATGWSRAGISTAATIDFLAMGLATLAWGALSDRYGARVVTLAGSLLLGAGLVAASQAQSLLQFQILFGVVVGVAVGSFYAPLMATASGWFENNRSLAVALISAGMGVAPLTVAPFVRLLIDNYDWRTAMLVVGVTAWALLVPAALLIRSPPSAASAGGPGAAAASDGYTLTATQAFRTPQFIAIALTHFACCAAHSGPIFHMVTYAIGCGIGAMAAVSVYSLAGLSGLAGRILLGITADRVGARPTLVAGLLVQAMGAGAYVFVSDLGAFYALSIVFGIAYGGVMPLYAILVRDYFGPRVMGTVFGAVSMAASLGMALGPWAGGHLFDSFGGYGWLHVGSFAIGLGAVAIALSFRPIRVAPPPPPAAAPA
ncbi:MAG: MFS transporter [Rhodospirillales bacterium]|nr:MAG: MFS transporter [Rhodospirillales bacterium]